MIEWYKKIDAKLLKKHPKLWILGLHFYIPILLVLYVIFYGIGFAFSMDPLPTRVDTRDFMSTISMFMIIPVILLTILFVIRQIKFNSLRVHHSLPYRNVILNFLSFVILSAAFFYLPFVVQLGTYHKAKTAINEEEFLADLQALENGYSHFYNNDAEHNSREFIVDAEAAFNEGALLDNTGKIYTTVYKKTYRIDESTQKLILFRTTLLDYRIRNREFPASKFAKYSLKERGWDTITLQEARAEITAFLAVCDKYEGISNFSSPDSLIDAQVKYCVEQLKFEEYSRQAFKALKDDSRFNDVVEFHEKVITRQSLFFAVVGDFFYIFIGFPLYFSLILLVLCSVKIADFGWGMLSIALGVTTYFTILGFYSLAGGSGWDDAFAFGLLMLYVVSVGLLTFGNFKIKPGLRKAFGIMFQLMLPIVVMVVFILLDELHDCPLPYDECKGFEYFESKTYYNAAYLTSIAAGLLSVFLFNRFYERRYVHPKD